MKILVTGGAGYLGSILVPNLLWAEHEVTVLDSFMYHQTPFNGWCAHPNFNVIKGDVRDWHEGSLMRKVIDGVDVVIPLAALVGAPLCDQDRESAIGTNYTAIQDLANAIPQSTKLIIPISNSGYGVGQKGKFCTEETPMNPISLYGNTKVWAEQHCLKNHKNTVSLRLATVFGMSPRMRLDLLVNEFVYRAVHDRTVVLFESHFKRNYIHVQDVARAFLFAIENFDKMKGQAYNVGLSDANLSKFELCERIKMHVPNFVPVEAPIGEDVDKRDYIVSNAKIEALGYKPAFSLDDGIRELVKGFTYLKRTEYGNI